RCHFNLPLMVIYPPYVRTEYLTGDLHKLWLQCAFNSNGQCILFTMPGINSLAAVSVMDNHYNYQTQLIPSGWISTLNDHLTNNLQFMAIFILSSVTLDT